jgi:hypothetical protein
VRVAKGTLEDMKEAGEDLHEPEAAVAEGVGADERPPPPEKEREPEGAESAREAAGAHADADGGATQDASILVRQAAEVVHLRDRKSGDAPDDREQVERKGKKSQRHSEERG